MTIADQITYGMINIRMRPQALDKIDFDPASPVEKATKKPVTHRKPGMLNAVACSMSRSP